MRFGRLLSLPAEPSKKKRKSFLLYALDLNGGGYSSISSPVLARAGTIDKYYRCGGVSLEGQCTGHRDLAAYISVGLGLVERDEDGSG